MLEHVLGPHILSYRLFCAQWLRKIQQYLNRMFIGDSRSCLRICFGCFEYITTTLGSTRSSPALVFHLYEKGNIFPGFQFVDSCLQHHILGYCGF